jgi:uncharacterized protein (DUF58 family)
VIRVSRWRGGLAGAVLLLAVGLVAGRAAAFAAAAVPLAFAVAAALDSAPTAADLRDDLAVDRRIEPSPAPPGRTVSVEVTVTNEGEETLADCRIVDRVPDELSVTRGTPRAAATLRPGESARIAYETTARRGSFTFEPPALRVRGPTAAAVETAAVPITGDDALECRLDAGDVPTRRRTIDRTGDLTTDEPGAGIEFHSTREYRPGDPVSRIDWKGFAKRGDLATVDFREQRAATMVLVLDARQAAHVVSAPGQPSAVELGAYAATHALDRLLAADHAVGLAVAGDATATPHGGTGTAAIRWIDPGTDRRTRSAVAAALADRHREAGAADGADARVRPGARRLAGGPRRRACGSGRGRERVLPGRRGGEHGRRPRRAGPPPGAVGPLSAAGRPGGRLAAADAARRRAGLRPRRRRQSEPAGNGRRARRRERGRAIRGSGRRWYGRGPRG